MHHDRLRHAAITEPDDGELPGPGNDRQRGLQRRLLPGRASSNVISDTKTFYDDKTSALSMTGMGTLRSLAYPGGLVTGTQSVSSWPSGGSDNGSRSR